MAKYSKDDKWYRARITSVREEELQVCLEKVGTPCARASLKFLSRIEIESELSSCFSINLLVVQTLT